MTGNTRANQGILGEGHGLHPSIGINMETVGSGIKVKELDYENYYKQILFRISIILIELSEQVVHITYGFPPGTSGLLMGMCAPPSKDPPT